MKTTNLDKITTEIANEAFALAGVTGGYDTNVIDVVALKTTMSEALGESEGFKQLSGDLTEMFLKQVSELLQHRMRKTDPSEAIDEMANLLGRGFSVLFYAGWIAHAVMQEKEKNVPATTTV
jgi:hypothetical protein